METNNWRPWALLVSVPKERSLAILETEILKGGCWLSAFGPPRRFRVPHLLLVLGSNSGRFTGHHPCRCVREESSAHQSLETEQLATKMTRTPVTSDSWTSAQVQGLWNSVDKEALARAECRLPKSD